MNETFRAARLAFLNAAYDWEKSEEPWLASVVDAAARAWGRPSYAFGLVYDASDVARFTVLTSVITSGPPSLRQILDEGWARLPPSVVAATYRAVPMGFGQPIGAIDAEATEQFARLSVTDIFALNGMDPSGKGCAIGLGIDRATTSSDELLLFERLTTHLTSAYRCRRRLKETGRQPTDAWEAILGPDGRLLDARGSAGSKLAREAVTHASRARENVRTKQGTNEPTDAWIPRIETRWTLLDAPSGEGDRLVVALENQVVAQGLGALTERERQVVVSAAMGKSQKEIAYDLGVSHATVRVLLGRARTRLGVAKQKELMTLPAIKALRGVD